MKKKLLLAIFIFVGILSYPQTQFWGMGSDMELNNAGLIDKADESADNITAEQSVNQIDQVISIDTTQLSIDGTKEDNHAGKFSIEIA